MRTVRGPYTGITAPRGFLAAGIAAGIKKGRTDDLALVVSVSDATAAAVFTRNRIQGAPVKLCRSRLASRRPARAIVINAGNANACTGPRGIRDARRVACAVARVLGVPEYTVWVCSTGVIGRPLPVDRIARAIPAAIASLSRKGGAAAARAILTTDTTPKQAAVECVMDGYPVRVGGMAKGAGMIAPHMATLLAFLTTDAAVRLEALQMALNTTVKRSFNRITVDGDQSCNDTVIFLANGQAGNPPLSPQHPQWPLFQKAVDAVALDLALRVVEDGEGATKRVTVRVQGALSSADAERAARAIANSLLVKTSWYGEDPNWGRIVDAVGYSGARVREDRIEVRFDDRRIVRCGYSVSSPSPMGLRRLLRRDAFTVTVDLHLGKGSATIYTCDCSPEYVRINAEYTT